MTRVCSLRFRLPLLVFFTAVSLTFAAAQGKSDRDTNTYKADLALVSLPSASNTGCPVDTVRFDVTGNGATTLGTASVSEFVCLDTTTLLFTAQFTVTAGNGDQVFGTASGFGVPTSPTTFDVRGTWNFSGGTGSFEGIQGHGASLGHVNLVTGASPHELIGNISRKEHSD